MASYSGGGGYKTNEGISNSYYAAKFSYNTVKTISLTCKHCGWKTRLLEGQEAPEVCEHCNHDPKTGAAADLEKVFHNEHADEAVKPASHVQVRWNCRKCGHYGLKWVEKKEKFNKVVCINCGSNNVNRRVLPAIGNKSGLW